MKSLWNNFKVAFAMFSKIPMPRADWTKENMKYMFCFFPFIGTVIGGLTQWKKRWKGRRSNFQWKWSCYLCGRAIFVEKKKSVLIIYDRGGKSV